MQHAYKYIVVIVLTFTFLCCYQFTKVPRQKRKIKNYSEGNELVLQKQAAKFLLSNITLHSSYDCNQNDSILSSIDTLYRNKPFWIKSAITVFHSKGFSTIYDINNTYDSTKLMQHINRMLSLRKMYHWYQYYSFEDFCEYILPYNHFEEFQDSIPVNNSLRSTLNKNIHDRLAVHNIYYDGDLNYIETKLKDVINQLSQSNIWEELTNLNINFSCREEAIAECHLYNSVGIPRVIDFVPHWANINGRHTWATSPYNLKIPYQNYAKIYRKTYSRNPIPTTSKRKEIIPNLFQDPFNKDVTSQYGNTDEISVELSKKRYEFENIYLYIFSEGNLWPIAWTKISGKYATFKNLGKGIVYFPGYNSINGMIIEGHPILLNRDGTSRELIPDHCNTQEMKLFRKYPLTQEKIDRIENLIGATILGYQDNNLRPDTLATIPSNYMTESMIALNAENSYKYIQIIPNRVMQIAEICILSENKDSIDFKTTSKEYNQLAICDNNYLTYSDFIPNLKLEIKDSEHLAFMRIMPRNDDNWINPGDVYELFYFCSQGWVSCGTKIATANFVTYSEVPSRALYLLKNHSKGTEERPFTWEDGKMTFW